MGIVLLASEKKPKYDVQYYSELRSVWDSSWILDTTHDSLDEALVRLFEIYHQLGRDYNFRIVGPKRDTNNNIIDEDASLYIFTPHKAINALVIQPGVN